MPILTSIAASKFLITSVTAGAIALGGGAAAFTNITTVDGSTPPAVTAPAAPSDTPTASPSAPATQAPAPTTTTPAPAPSAPATTAPAPAPAPATPAAGDEEKPGDESPEPVKPAPAPLVTPAPAAPAAGVSGPAAAEAPRDHDEAGKVEVRQHGQHEDHFKGQQDEGHHKGQHEGSEGFGR